MKYTEKRIFRRIDTQVPVELSWGSQSLQTSALNISCGGMFLNIEPKQVEDLSEVGLAIHLPHRDHPVKLTGKIQRVERNGRRGIAVQFQGLPNDNTLAVETFVKSKLN